MVRLASIVTSDGQTKLVAQVLSKKSSEGGGDCCKERVSHYVDISNIAPNVRSFLERGDTALTKARELIAECRSSDDDSSKNTNKIIPASDVDTGTTTTGIQCPFDSTTCSKFLCVGMNYVDHCAEQNIPIPTEPVIFNKFASSLAGQMDPVILDTSLVKKLDYEVELGIVIGKRVPRNIDSSQASQYIGGYTVVHDVSARDWQLERNGNQWLLGKCQDTYGPIGPVVVTSDELSLSQVQNLTIQCYVNSKMKQNSNTSQMVFKCDAIVSWISKFVTLEIGDIIATGTPPGVGCFLKPTPQFLKPGDVVKCYVEKIGTLISPIVDSKDKSAVASVPSAASSTTTAQKKGRLHGQVCIVTGGAGGIGYGIAAKLGSVEEQAAVVAIIDLKLEAVNKAVYELQQATSSTGTTKYVGIACDVTNLQAVQKAWEQVATTYGNGHIDILVQAAGIVGTTNVKTQDVDSDNFNRVMNVNVNGTFNGCKAVLPYMISHKFGRIINVASIAGKEGNAGMLAYSTSKAAAIGLTKSIGKEYADPSFGDITCNAIAPAVVKTQMVSNMPDAQVRYMTDKIPMKRCGTINEIASLVCYVASKDSSFTTGFCYDATGGRSVY